mmetsp:Transcript_14345/g.19363  ORF Transcript_14345/g.19363 Transcript_14345/m.19363 type:complete len:120 (-) Transcript_14345:176-535(-)
MASAADADALRVERDWDAHAQTSLLHMAAAESASQEMVLSLRSLLEGETPPAALEAIRVMMQQQQSMALEAQQGIMLDVEEAKAAGPAAAAAAAQLEELPPRLGALEVTLTEELGSTKA